MWLRKLRLRGGGGKTFSSLKYKFMGNVSSDFPYVAETELFKFYFSNISHINRNNNRIELTVPNGDSCRNVTSLVYYLQFVSLNTKQVLEEITVHCKYQCKNNNVKITLKKHILGNLETSDNIKEVYEMTRVGFPKAPLIVTNTTKIIFQRMMDKGFIILLVDGDDEKPVGILNFTNVGSYDTISIEPVVKCVIKGALKEIKDISASIHSPVLNNGSVFLPLTNQYRISVSVNKKANIINVFDGGVTNINFNDNTADIYSIRSSPKSKISIVRRANGNKYEYQFKDHVVTY